MQSSAWVGFLLDTENPGVQTLTLKIDPAQMGYFNSFNYQTIILQLEFGEGTNVVNGASFLKLTVDSTHTATPQLNKGQGIINGITWDAKKLSISWKLEFDLNSEAIKPLLKDGHIDGKKLLNVQLIGLYNAKVY
jgi:hypothetical protein